MGGYDVGVGREWGRDGRMVDGVCENVGWGGIDGGSDLDERME